MFTSLIPLKDRLPFSKNNTRNIKEKITKALIKFIKFLSFDLLVVISDNPRIATNGMHSSKITWIEDTALNLSYNWK